ncbi:TMhelix containing protein [Vibrio phage 2.275.O._10N.286.54.E11]|nr:TMhelix containing protein [Vibrio phage 2.275.O._10N.286.54.E11]
MLLTIALIWMVIGITTEALYYHFGTSEYEKLLVGYGLPEIIIPALCGVTWCIVRGYDAYDDFCNRSF